MKKLIFQDLTPFHALCRTRREQPTAVSGATLRLYRRGSGASISERSRFGSGGEMLSDSQPVTYIHGG